MSTTAAASSIPQPAGRPVWRVDVIATKPSGAFRCYVDAETGKVLLRTDLRASTPRGPVPQR